MKNPFEYVGIAYDMACFSSHGTLCCSSCQHSRSAGFVPVTPMHFPTFGASFVASDELESRLTKQIRRLSTAVYWRRMVIDTAFDFRTDASGKDPDVYSPTLRQYHKLLWSKVLPSGRQFELHDTVRGVYLFQRL